MQRTYRHPPNIDGYPKWMREYLALGYIGTRTDLREYEKALYHIHESARADPVCTVLFENTMGLIRLRHHVAHLCIKHEDAIDVLEKRIDALEKLVKSTRKHMLEMEQENRK